MSYAFHMISYGFHMISYGSADGFLCCSCAFRCSLYAFLGGSHCFLCVHVFIWFFTLSLWTHAFLMMSNALFSYEFLFAFWFSILSLWLSIVCFHRFLKHVIWVLMFFVWFPVVFISFPVVLLFNSCGFPMMFCVCHMNSYGSQMISYVFMFSCDSLHFPSKLMLF